MLAGPGAPQQVMRPVVRVHRTPGTCPAWRGGRNRTGGTGPDGAPRRRPMPLPQAGYRRGSWSPFVDVPYARPWSANHTVTGMAQTASAPAFHASNHNVARTQSGTRASYRFAKVGGGVDVGRSSEGYRGRDARRDAGGGGDVPRGRGPVILLAPSLLRACIVPTVFRGDGGWSGAPRFSSPRDSRRRDSPPIKPRAARARGRRSVRAARSAQPSGLLRTILFARLEALA